MCSLTASKMAAVCDRGRFLSRPSIEQLESCREADLIILASHFNLPFSGALFKKELRALVIRNWGGLGMLVLPAEPVKGTGICLKRGLTRRLLKLMKQVWVGMNTCWGLGEEKPRSHFHVTIRSHL